MVDPMTPYQPGQSVAVLVPDVYGLRVREGLVQGIEGQRVNISIKRGDEAELHSLLVDDRGFALDPTARIRIMPMDERLAAELQRQGPEILVPTSQIDLLDIAENVEEATVQLEVRIEQARSREQGHGYGY